MIFTSLALFSGMVLFASAAPGWKPPPPVTHCVDVSNEKAELFYDPPYVDAAPGDTIKFTFYPKNHTVTESTFDCPCTNLPGGVDTGFIPVPLGTDEKDLPFQEFTVKDDKPVWIHCRQGEDTPASHCGKGMVFAVNPGKDKFKAFLENALAVGKKLADGKKW